MKTGGRPLQKVIRIIDQVHEGAGGEEGGDTGQADNGHSLHGTLDLGRDAIGQWSGPSIYRDAWVIAVEAGEGKIFQTQNDSSMTAYI